MKVAVIIPFRGDAGVLSWVLDGFARQQLPDGVMLEVRVGGDGVAVPQPPDGSRQIQFVMKQYPRVGISEAKNLLLREGAGDVVIFVNGDTRPNPDFVSAHVARLMALPAGSMVLGATPYQEVGEATVFDALKAESPIIFFYSQMQPQQWYDFRHAWNMNVSVRYADLPKGFFAAQLRPVDYEDLDLAFRIMGAERKSVYFDDAAVLTHRHPMTLAQYLDREEMLGITAPSMHRVNAALFRALHGTDDLEAVAAEFSAWVKMDLASHRWVWERLNEWCRLPASVLGEGESGPIAFTGIATENAGQAHAANRDESRRRLIGTIYQMHVPLKRLAFRLGFLRGMELREDGRWQERKAEGRWKDKVLRTED